MEKCFCHIVDKNGQEYEVKDAFARREIAEMDGRVDGKLAVFMEYAEPTLDKMEEIHNLTLENIETIRGTADAAAETIRSIITTEVHTEVDEKVNEAKDVIYGYVLSTEKQIGETKNEAIAAVEAAQSELNTDISGINKTIDEFNNRYSHMGTSIIKDRALAINSGSSSMPISMEQNNEFIVSIYARKLTFLITLTYRERATGSNKYVRFPFDVYPACNWTVSQSPLHTVIGSHRIVHSEYVFDAVIKESVYNDTKRKIVITGTFGVQGTYMDNWYPYSVGLDRLIITEDHS